MAGLWNWLFVDQAGRDVGANVVLERSTRSVLFSLRSDATADAVFKVFRTMCEKYDFQIALDLPYNEVFRWLHRYHLEQYWERFLREDLTSFNVILQADLNEVYLRRMVGVKVAHLQQLLDALSNLRSFVRSGKWAPRKASFDVERDGRLGDLSNYRVALFDYAAAELGELTFAKGDVIQVIERGDPDGWWAGVLPGGSKGLFPVRYTDAHTPAALGENRKEIKKARDHMQSVPAESFIVQDDPALICSGGVYDRVVPPSGRRVGGISSEAGSTCARFHAEQMSSDRTCTLEMGFNDNHRKVLRGRFHDPEDWLDAQSEFFVFFFDEFGRELAGAELLNNSDS